MSVSHSALEFLRASGIQDGSLNPRPRLDVDALLIHTTPFGSPPLPAEQVLQDFEGGPPPDRNLTRPWPGQPLT